MRRSTQLSSRVLLAGTLVIASACQDNVTAPADDDFAEARSITKIATEVQLRVEQTAFDGTITYSVRVRSTSRTLSSFQGALTFTPGAFDVRSAEAATGGGAVILLNTNDLANGRIRFAAYTQTAFDGSGDGKEVFRFTSRQIRDGDVFMSPTLDVIGTAPNPSASAGALAANVSAQACSGTTLWGDGTADGLVNITDAQQLARFSTGLTVGNLAAVTGRGDVTADGNVNIIDAQQIARYSVGLSAAARTNTWMC